MGAGRAASLTRRRAASLVVAVAVSLVVARALRRGAPTGRAPVLLVSASASAAASAPASASAAAARPVGSGAVRPGPPSMFRLDPRRTNRSPFVAPKAPRVAWSLDLGGPIATAPVVVGELVVAASLSGKIVGVTLSGETRWELDAKDRLYGSPVVVGHERVAIGRDKGELWIVDTARGRVVQKHAFPKGDCDTSPLVMPGGALVLAVGRDVFELGPRRRTLLELDRKVFASLAQTDDGVVVASQEGRARLLGLDAKTRWEVDLQKDADATPVVDDDGTAFFGTDAGEAWAISREGKIRFRVQVGGGVRGALSVARDGTVLVPVVGEGAGVVGLDPRTGAERLRFHVDRGPGRALGVVGAPLEDREGTLVFGAEDDHVYALSSSGELGWKLRRGGDVDLAVVLARDGTLLVGAYDGTLAAVEDAPR